MNNHKNPNNSINQTSSSKISIQKTEYHWPIPPASELANYNNIQSWFTDRILSMAENQSKHRMELEKIAINSQLKQSERWQIFWLAVAIFGFICATALGLYWQPLLWWIIWVMDISAIVYMFVIWKKEQSKKETV